MVVPTFDEVSTKYVKRDDDRNLTGLMFEAQIRGEYKVLVADTPPSNNCGEKFSDTSLKHTLNIIVNRSGLEPVYTVSCEDCSYSSPAKDTGFKQEHGLLF